MEDIKNGRVLVDFYATWCGPCKMMLKQIEKYEAEIDQVKVVKIDIDKYFEMASEFGIRAVPTIVYLEDGKIINRTSGIKDLQQLKEFTNIV